MLLKGPDLTTLLLGVFVRFRERAVGVSADIAKMFYQVLVAPDDRDLFRFLWRRPGSNDPIAEYAMTVHVSADDRHPRRVSRGSCSYKSDFYVDNLLTSFDTVDEGTRVC